MSSRVRSEPKPARSPFHEHDRACVDVVGQRLTRGADQHSTPIARRPLDGCSVRLSLLVHTS